MHRFMMISFIALSLVVVRKESFNVKRKFFRGSKGLWGQNELQRGQGRHWSLSNHAILKRRICLRLSKKQQYERARKENLCLNYFEPRHSKAVYTKLRTGGSSNNTEKYEKSSQSLHAIHILSLGYFDFRQVSVSHTNSTHAFCISQTMSQSSLILYGLVCLYGNIGDHYHD